MKINLLLVIGILSLSMACFAVSQPIWKVTTTKQIVALTFDDGPKPWFSEEILAILSRYGVRATFFVVGKEVENSSDMIMQMDDMGHEIGNHTFAHTTVKGLSFAKAREPIEAANRAVKKVTGRTPMYFRPPGGQYDDNTLAVLDALGMRMINWSVNPGDYAENLTQFTLDPDYAVEADKVIERVLGKVHPGAIILFHNGPEQTVRALPKIIESLRAQGYQFVTISELLRSSTNVN